MSEPQEFQYRIPRRVAGWRPGSHPGLALGAGQEFVTHMSLFDRPDPRRLDLRASVRSLRHEWLVRVNRQRTSVAVHVVIDVSASMSFGSSRPKLEAAADFVEALGQSAFRVGDALGLIAFDAREREDLHVPAILSRGAGSVMAEMLRNVAPGAAGATGITDAMLPLAGREGLVFLCSDFHWPLEIASPALDLLSHAYVVP
ncbi:MAG TPA: VWA domain-containing protein, partial [Steroidobacteraceae bacterium]